MSESDDDLRLPLRLPAELVGERRHHQRHRSVALDAAAAAERDRRRLRIARAQRGAASRPVVPVVADHAVHERQRPRADGRMSGTRHRPGVRVGRPAEDRAAIEDPSQAVFPLVAVRLGVVRAELIDDEKDDQAGRIGPRLRIGRDERRATRGGERTREDGQPEGAPRETRGEPCFIGVAPNSIWRRRARRRRRSSRKTSADRARARAVPDDGRDPRARGQ